MNFSLKLKVTLPAPARKFSLFTSPLLGSEARLPICASAQLIKSCSRRSLDYDKVHCGPAASWSWGERRNRWSPKAKYGAFRKKFFLKKRFQRKRAKLFSGSQLAVFFSHTFDAALAVRLPVLWLDHVFRSITGKSAPVGRCFPPSVRRGEVNVTSERYGSVRTFLRLRPPDSFPFRTASLFSKGNFCKSSLWTPSKTFVLRFRAE